GSPQFSPSSRAPRLLPARQAPKVRTGDDSRLRLGVDAVVATGVAAGDGRSSLANQASSSSFSSQASTEVRVPGVSLGSMALITLAPAAMASPVGNSCR